MSNPPASPPSEEMPRMTAEHDADIAYYEEHVRGTRRDSLNPQEWPTLDAEIVRIQEVRRVIARLAGESARCAIKPLVRYTARPASEVQTRPESCWDCDGCGWCEGSPAYTCHTCKGSGVKPLPGRETA